MRPLGLPLPLKWIILSRNFLHVHPRQLFFQQTPNETQLVLFLLWTFERSWYGLCLFLQNSSNSNFKPEYLKDFGLSVHWVSWIKSTGKNKQIFNITYYKSELLTELHPNKLHPNWVTSVKKDPQTCSDSNLPGNSSRWKLTKWPMKQLCVPVLLQSNGRVPWRLGVTGDGCWWWLMVQKSGKTSCDS